MSVRAADVHKAMGLKNRLPAVVSALGTLKVQSYANVEVIRIDGPLMGANTTLTFKLL